MGSAGTSTHPKELFGGNGSLLARSSGLVLRRGKIFMKTVNLLLILVVVVEIL